MERLILDFFKSKGLSAHHSAGIVGNLLGESNLNHEATVARISQDKLFYLMSRGISEERAKELIIMGFIERFRDELPMEYAVELNALLKNYF